MGARQKHQLDVIKVTLSICGLLFCRTGLADDSSSVSAPAGLGGLGSAPTMNYNYQGSGDSGSNTTSSAGSPSDGTQSSDGEKISVGAASKIARAANGGNNNGANGPSGPPDPTCTVSEQTDGQRYDCTGTIQKVRNMNMAIQAGNMVGSQGVQAVGAIQTQNAMASAATTGTVSTSAALNASAATQKDAGYAQLAIGALSATAATMEYKAASQHSTNQQELANAAKANDQVAVGASNTNAFTNVFNNPYAQLGGTGLTVNGQAPSEILNSQGGASATQAATASTDVTLAKIAVNNKVAQKATNTTTAQTQTADVATSGANEQGKVAQTAKAAAIQSTMVAAVQMLKGAGAIAAGMEEEKAANALSNSNVPTFTVSSGNLTPGSATSASGTALNPDTTAAGTPLDAQQAAGGITASSGCGALGCANPANTIGNNLAAGPTPGAFGAAAGGGGGGGGNGGGMGDMTTAPSKDETPSDQPKAVDNRGAPAFVAGNPNFNNGGVSAEKGPDLSGLLAQFLPKKEEENKNGILDFANRNPASAGDGSLLGRNENLFKRISERMQTDYRKGSVGIPEHKI